MPLKLRSINAKSPLSRSAVIPKPGNNEQHRPLYISGQIPMARGGAVPDSFAEQAKLVWSNVLAQLEAADMTIGNLVTIFRSHCRGVTGLTGIPTARTENAAETP
jgi:2-iminobutanoate/2-iminopropanoate deaminase